MNRVVILGWIFFLSGSAIWLYGYCSDRPPIDHQLARKDALVDRRLYAKP